MLVDAANDDVATMFIQEDAYKQLWTVLLHQVVLVKTKWQGHTMTINHKLHVQKNLVKFP